MPVRVRVSPSAPFQNRPEIALQVERGIPIIRVPIDAGWSSLVARRAHNPKVVGSNPAPATTTRTVCCNRYAGRKAIIRTREAGDRKILSPFDPKGRESHADGVGFRPFFCA